MHVIISLVKVDCIYFSIYRPSKTLIQQAHEYNIITMKYLLLLSLAVLSLSLRPRQDAPPFQAIAVLPNHSFQKISLSDYAGKYVVLLFYPFDFTYVCPTEITSYSDAIEEFKKIDTEVLAISVDSHFSHLAWRKTSRDNGGLGQVNIPLVADITKSISQSYGVLVEDENDPLNGASLRGLFIIDGKGTIRSITINDEQVGRNAEETLRTIKAFKHADEHGVVCPAGWKPGSKTIIPDQDKSKEYFKQL